MIYSGYSAGRDEKLFPNPMKFNPERWKRDESHAFAIQPFGFGPRGCYGKIHAWKVCCAHILACSNEIMTLSFQYLLSSSLVMT